MHGAVRDGTRHPAPSAGADRSGQQSPAAAGQLGGRARRRQVLLGSARTTITIVTGCPRPGKNPPMAKRASLQPTKARVAKARIASVNPAPAMLTTAGTFRFQRPRRTGSNSWEAEDVAQRAASRLPEMREGTPMSSPRSGRRHRNICDGRQRRKRLSAVHINPNHQSCGNQYERKRCRRQTRVKRAAPRRAERGSPRRYGGSTALSSRSSPGEPRQDGSWMPAQERSCQRFWRDPSPAQ